jgi:hypothetical protein
MSDSRWARIAPLTGVGFVLLLLAGVLTINNYAYLAPAEEVKAFYDANAARVSGGAYLILVSAVSLLWFAGSLRSALRTAEGGTGRLSAVAFAGGIAAAAAIMVAMSAMLTISELARVKGVVPGDAAMMLHGFSQNLMGVMLPVALGVMIAATAVVAYRTGFLSRWAIWVSGIIALGSISPLAYLVGAAAILWIAVMSFVLYTRGRQQAAV